ncbi:MAG: PilZ domain-containing protein [Myxococcota bacterium]
MQRKSAASQLPNDASMNAGPPRRAAVSGHYTRTPNPYGTEVSIVGVGLTVCSRPSLAPLELEFDQSTQLYADLSGDLASGGLFVATYQMLPVGTRVELEIELSDWTRLCVYGRVAWQRPVTQDGAVPGIGVAFENLSPTALAALTSCCMSEPPLYFDP